MYESDTKKQDYKQERPTPKSHTLSYVIFVECAGRRVVVELTLIHKKARKTLRCRHKRG